MMCRIDDTHSIPPRSDRRYQGVYATPPHPLSHVTLSPGHTSPRMRIYPTSTTTHQKWGTLTRLLRVPDVLDFAENDPASLPIVFELHGASVD
jgi:hypothetical protein